MGAALLAAAVLAPTAQALAATDHLWSLRVLAGRGEAQAREALQLQGEAPALLLDLPPGAREVQAFAGGAPAPWSWADDHTLRVDLPAGARDARVEVRYLLSAGPVGLAATKTLTLDTARLDVEAGLPTGWRGSLGAQELDRAGRASLGPLAAGQALTLHLAPDTGPSPVVVLGALTLLVLLGTLARAWTARGRETHGQPMGLLGHLQELSSRLRVALLAVALLMLALFTFALEPVDVLGQRVPVPVPSLGDNIASQTFRLLAQQYVPQGVELVVMSPVTGAMVQVEVALFLAVLVASPLLAYEAGAFLMPALLPRERKLLLRTVPVVTGLFIAGAAFAYVVMVPTMMRVLYTYAQGLGARPFIAVDSLVSFAIIVTLMFGAAFELPAVMLVLAKLGVVSPATMASKWRHIVVGIFVGAAIITPDPSVVSQLLVAIPMLGLYLAGLAAAKLAVDRPAASGGARHDAAG